MFLEKASVSILVGLALTAVVFLPLLVWQYRKWGRFDAGRMLWTAAGYIYVSALAAFTMFPLPDFSDEFCEAHRAQLTLDLLRAPRDFTDQLQSEGILQAVNSWLVWELVLNVALFVPLGFILRRVVELPWVTVLVMAFGTTAFIELTQYTGNWWLAPCPYRFADATDLVTNSLGAGLGMCVERITPRLLSTKKYLQERKDQARPVTRGRRLAGIVLDAWYLILAVTSGGLAGAFGYLSTQGGPGQELSAEQYLHLQASISLGAWLACLLLIYFPAALGTGASLGQRSVYLCPAGIDHVRFRVLGRTTAVQVVLATGLCLGVQTGVLAIGWAFADVVAALINIRGLSFAVARLSVRDSRSQPPRQRAGSMHVASAMSDDIFS